MLIVTMHGEGRGVLPDDRQEGDTAQNIAMENSLPTIYLVDSAGVFLLCRRMCFRIRTTLDGSFAITRDVGEGDSADHAIMECVSPVERICR